MNASSALATCPSCGSALLGPGACGGACGSSAGCAFICCPGCGVALPHPQRARLAARLARWLARRKAARAEQAALRAEPPLATDGTMLLSRLPAGRPARVAALGASGSGAMEQLAAFGLVPGAALVVRQRHPALLLEVGHTTLALDASVARTVRVAPGGGPDAAAQPSQGRRPS